MTLLKNCGLGTIIFRLWELFIPPSRKGNTLFPLAARGIETSHKRKIISLPDSPLTKKSAKMATPRFIDGCVFPGIGSMPHDGHETTPDVADTIDVPIHLGPTMGTCYHPLTGMPAALHRCLIIPRLSILYIPVLSLAATLLSRSRMSSLASLIFSVNRLMDSVFSCSSLILSSADLIRSSSTFVFSSCCEV